MQYMHALKKPKNSDGLIADSNGNVNWRGQWVMLEALSDLGKTLLLLAVPHSVTNRYRDPKTSQMLLNSSNVLFAVLSNRSPVDTGELSLAIQSLMWYAYATNNKGNVGKAAAKIAEFGDKLIAKNNSSATDNAYAVRGLIEAYRATGNEKYLDKAAKTFEKLSTQYIAEDGYFKGQNAYTINDVAVILGAVNSVKLFAGDKVNQDRAEQIFKGFFESTVNISGLQLSAPPKGLAKGKFEQHHPDIFYAYPGMAIPPKAGGKYGVAPVFGSEIQWKNGAWELTNARFNSAGAMHASNEFIWFHNDEVNGFPEIR